ncbi:short chain dehydrogenase [Ceratobasidium sp. AG-Ba]|nr:short chain dehydrogenase [Ceratobasidium sp. AG-Ba]
MGSFLSAYPRTETKITGRVAVVIGANRGIWIPNGQATHELGATVYLGCRDETKALDAINRIRADVTASDGQLKWFHADMSSIKKARKSAEAFIKVENQLDILINNAAIANMTFSLNEEGVAQYGSSVIISGRPHSIAVLDLMKQTSTKPGSDVRIVCVNSNAHTMLTRCSITFDDEADLISKPFPPTDYDTWSGWLARYGRSKLANLLFANELQRRLEAEGSNIIVLSLHPGAVRTDSALQSVAAMPIAGPVARFIASFMFMDEATGALNTIFAATNPAVRAEPEKYKGKYLEPVGKITPPAQLAQDQELAKRVWDLGERVIQASGV